MALERGNVALDTRTGECLGNLWDGPDTSVEFGPFCPRGGDMRLLATSTVSGVKRPLIWDVRTGTRTDLALDDLHGEVEPWEWSPDGTQVLLCHVAQARQQLYLYGVADGALRRLNHPTGTLSRCAGRLAYPF